MKQTNTGAVREADSKLQVAGARCGWYRIWPKVSTVGRLLHKLALMCYINHGATDVAIRLQRTTYRDSSALARILRRNNRQYWLQTNQMLFKKKKKKKSLWHITFKKRMPSNHYNIRLTVKDLNHNIYLKVMCLQWGKRWFKSIRMRRNFT